MATKKASALGPKASSSRVPSNKAGKSSTPKKRDASKIKPASKPPAAPASKAAASTKAAPAAKAAPATKAAPAAKAAPATKAAPAAKEAPATKAAPAAKAAPATKAAPAAKAAASTKAAPAAKAAPATKATPAAKAAPATKAVPASSKESTRRAAVPTATPRLQVVRSRSPVDVIQAPWVPICGRCNKRVLHTDDAERSAQCYTCHRFYHVPCYLVDIGWEKADRVQAATRGHKCSACLSGVFRLEWFVAEARLTARIISSFPRGWFRHRNKYAPESFAAALTLLHQGFVVLPLSSIEAATTKGNSLSKGVPIDEGVKDTLVHLRDHLTKLLEGLRHSYERLVSNASVSGGSVVSMATGFQNFRMRCEGRYEILSPRVGAALYPLVSDSRLISEVLQLALNCEKPRRMSDGCFFSQAGSEAQNLHTDGPPLLSRLDGTLPPSAEARREGAAHDEQRPSKRRRKDSPHNCDDDEETLSLPRNDQLFPYAINCFVPLVDVTGSNGTEFYPESHLLPDVHAAQSGDVKPHKIAPAVPFGHVLLFDYRVTHRGLPNKCGSDRPCAYVTYSQRWYSDTYNFASQRFGKPLEVEQALMESREERYLRRHTE